MQGKKKQGLSRRKFLKASGAGAALLASAPYLDLMALTPSEASASTGPDGIWVHGMCSFCMFGCPIRAKVVDGKIERIEGNKDMPILEGKICAKGISAVDRLYRPDRLKTPLKRIGKRGEGKFKRISWEEALTEIAAHMKKYRDDGHPEAVAFLWGCPMQTPSIDFFDYFRQVYGSPNFSHFHGDSCYSSGAVANMMTGIPPFSTMCDFSESKYTVHVGYCPTTGSWTPGGTWTMRDVAKGLKQGLELEIVDPRMEEDGAMFNWTPVRPDTDIAFAMGLIQVLIKEVLYDVEFVSKYTNGPVLIRTDTGLPAKDGEGKYLAWDLNAKKPVPHDSSGIKAAILGTYTVDGVKCRTALDLLRERVEEFTPEKVARICEIPQGPEKIREIARKLGNNKPRSCVQISSVAAAKQANVIQKLRAFGIVNALLGNLDKPGGIYFLQPPISGGPYYMSFGEPLGKTPPKIEVPNVDYDPVEYPFGSIDLPVPSRYYSAVSEGKPYPIKMLFITSVNMFNHAAEPTRKMLTDAEFTVVCENWPTITVDWADIVLPDATYLERETVRQSTWSTYPFIANRGIVKPPEGVRPLAEVCLEIGKRLGLGEYFDFTMEQWYNKQLEQFGIDIDHLKKNGPYYKFDKQYEKFPYKSDPWKITSRSGKIEIYSSWLGEDFYLNEKSPYFKNPDVDPLPHDFRTMRRDLADDEFYLVTGKSAINAHSSSAGNRYLNERYVSEGIGLHRVWISAQRASGLGIKDGDTISIESKVTGAKGQVTVKVTEAIHPTTAFMYHQFCASSKGIETDIGPLVGIMDNDFQPHNEEPLSGGLGRCQMIVKLNK
jgi:thiosulfate reductase/polysulfide reductase chain A